MNAGVCGTSGEVWLRRRRRRESELVLHAVEAVGLLPLDAAQLDGGHVLLAEREPLAGVLAAVAALRPQLRAYFGDEPREQVVSSRACTQMSGTSTQEWTYEYAQCRKSWM